MSRYIDRAELFNRLSSVKTLAEAYAVVQEMPAVDIVRCGECKHHNPYCKTQSLDGVIRAVYCETLDMYVPIDWYCGSGEREEGAE